MEISNTLYECRIFNNIDGINKQRLIFANIHLYVGTCFFCGTKLYKIWLPIYTMVCATLRMKYTSTQTGN